MKEGNIILQKSYAFAVRIVRLSQFLVKEKQAFQLADQNSSQWNFHWS